MSFCLCPCFYCCLEQVEVNLSSGLNEFVLGSFCLEQTKKLEDKMENKSVPKSVDNPLDKIRGGPAAENETSGRRHLHEYMPKMDTVVFASRDAWLI